MTKWFEMKFFGDLIPDSEKLYLRDRDLDEEMQSIQTQKKRAELRKVKAELSALLDIDRILTCEDSSSWNISRASVLFVDNLALEWSRKQAPLVLKRDELEYQLEVRFPPSVRLAFQSSSHTAQISGMALHRISQVFRASTTCVTGVSRVTQTAPSTRRWTVSTCSSTHALGQIRRRRRQTICGERSACGNGTCSSC